MTERLTKWEGKDSEGNPRAVLAKREGSWIKNMDEGFVQVGKI